MMMEMTLASMLPLAFMAVMGLALLAYVILDGYDLGVGILLPWATDDEKDTMVASVGPFWDSNETWLVLGVGILLIAFPAAHGVVLSALYLPVAVMLLGLTLRGVSFDFRVKARASHKGLWNKAFSAGSYMATVAQGWMLGAYITGFDNTALGLLFALAVAITLPAAYAMLGAGWLIMKTENELQDKAMIWGRKVLLPMTVALVVISLATPIVSHSVFEKWFNMPAVLALLPIPITCVGALAVMRHVLYRPALVRGGYGWLVFGCTVLVFILAFLGLAYSIYPYIVVDQMTIWQAASATESLVVIAIGVAISLPAIIAYTVFMYRVFWGKSRTLTYGL